MGIIRNFLDKRRKKREEQEAREHAEFIVRYKQIKKELEDEVAEFGRPKEIHFESTEEADSFIKGVKFAMENEGRITRIKKTSEWWVSINVK